MSEQGRHCDEPRKPVQGEAFARASGADLDREWPSYFDAVEGNPARDTLLQALDHFDAEGGADDRLAVDLGAGSGRDTEAMLKRGWRVTAIDASADGLTRLAAKCAGEPGAALRLVAIEARFEEMDLGQIVPEGASLVNASMCLPFCPPEAFARVWSQIVETMRRAAARGRPARFAGQLFGDRDGWSHIPARNHQTRAEVDRLLDGMVVEKLEEIDRDGKDAFGNPKHYHIFHIVARLEGAGGPASGGES